jgi:hypothetical protein
MSPDKARRSARDRSRVAVDDDDDVRYWTETFGVTEDELRDAVRTSGFMIDDVRAHLRRSRG